MGYLLNLKMKKGLHNKQSFFYLGKQLYTFLLNDFLNENSLIMHFENYFAPFRHNIIGISSKIQTPYQKDMPLF